MKLELVPEPEEQIKKWIKISDNLLLHVVSGFYYVRKKKAGKGELFKSTGLKTKGKAQTKADDMVGDWMGTKAVSRRPKTISEVCDELSEVLKKEFENGDRRKRTHDKDRTYIPIIERHFGDVLVSEVDEEFWASWVRISGKGLGRTLGDIAKYLSKVLTFAYQRKYISRKSQIINPDKPKKSGMIYENSDIEKFINHADPLLRDMIIIGAECGLRPHENRGLNWDWIEFSDECVIIRIPGEFAKTGTGRSLEASPNASQCLRKRFLTRKGPYVFPALTDAHKALSDCQFSRLWRTMLKSAEMPAGIKFHWLRHSFFTKALLDAKLPLAEVAQYGGNSPTILMKKYLQDDPARTRGVSRAVSLDLEKIRCGKGVD